MATTTPNFGWAVPTSTDLVKDGAVAIETLGDSIDASLVDLKGGTIGQVLAKATNTDMDFTWTTPSGGSNTFYAGKNKIINGDFYVNQRNFSTFTTTTGGGSSYGFDRWLGYNYATGGSLTYSAQTFTAGTAPVSGYEGANFARLVTSNMVNAGDGAIIYQSIENVRNFAGQTATISFWAKAASGTPKVAIEIQQGFGTGGSPSASVNTYAGQATLSTSWARYSITVAVPSISGKTVGTTANTSYVGLNIFVSAGSTYNARTGSLGNQNNTFDFWGFQMEAGSSATDFQTASGSIGGELALCQRYYFKDGKVVGQDGYAQNATTIYFKYYHPVAMRTTPTYTQTGGATFSSNTSATTFTTDANGSNELSTNFYFLVGASNGYTYLYRPVEWSAEL
jgi:hypothetical protein